MALRTRRDVYGVDTRIDASRLCPASRLVAAVTGSHVQRNKAIVGDNAFAHEAGIHQHGVLRNRATYEIMRPQDVGYNAGSIVLGKHSGKHAIRARVEQLGYTVSDEELAAIMRRFKPLADRKKEIYDADLEALVLGHDPSMEGPWRLVALTSSGGTQSHQTATVELEHMPGGETVTEASVGDGPVDAMFKAVVRATGVAMELRDYKLRSVSSGEDAQGEAMVDVVHDGVQFRGRGVSTDVVEATAFAVLDVVNRVIRMQEARLVPRENGGAAGSAPVTGGPGTGAPAAGARAAS